MSPTLSPTLWNEHPSNYWVPCQTGPWEEWGACTASCGVGVMKRRRVFIAAHKNPHWDSKSVSAFLIRKYTRSLPPYCELSQSLTQKYLHERLACSAGGACPIDCTVSDWSVWTVVTYAGKHSDQIARRRSVRVEAQFGGKRCPVMVEYKNFKGTEDCSASHSFKGGLKHGIWSACDAKTKKQTRVSVATRCPKEAALLLKLKMKQVRPCTPDAANLLYFGGDYSKPGFKEDTDGAYKFDNRAAMLHAAAP